MKHIHSFGVDACCNCGVMISELMQSQAACLKRLELSNKELYDVAAWLIQEREIGTDKGLLPDGLLQRARFAIAISNFVIAISETRQAGDKTNG